MLVTFCVFCCECRTSLKARTKKLIFLPAKLVSLVLSPDPLRSGQGRWHPLQHHWSRRWSAAEWDLQHRPHQRQHVCHSTPGQRGEGLLPCKEEMNLSFLFSVSPPAPFMAVSLSPNYPCGNAPRLFSSPSSFHSNTNVSCQTSTSQSAFREHVTLLAAVQ